MKAMALATIGLIFLAQAVQPRLAQAGVVVGDWRADQIRQREDDDEWAWARAMRKPLYQAESFPDGVKGRLIGALPPRTGWSLPLGTPAAVQERYNTSCFSDAVVLAQTEDSQSVLTSDDKDILTRTRLKVLGVIKAPPGLAVGDQIAIVRSGGEVFDHGERLRVRNDGWSDFTPGRVFILKLEAVHHAGMDHYFNLIYREAAIADMRLVGEWDLFAAGTPYADVKEDLQRLPGSYACPPSR